MGRILHATDFSPASRAAFAKAISLAKANKSELVIAQRLGEGADSAAIERAVSQ